MEIVKDGFLFEMRFSDCVLKRLVTAKPDMEVPSSVNGKPVATIAENAFKGCVGVNTLILPDNITHISKHAFYAAQIYKIERRGGNKMLFVGEEAFKDSQVGHVSFGGITFLDCYGSQFQNCTQLTYVDSKNIMGLIPENAFNNTGLHYIVLRHEVQIADDAFANTNLDMIVLAGILKDTGNFFPTHDSATIICEGNNPVVELAYLGHTVSIKEECK